MDEAKGKVQVAIYRNAEGSGNVKCLIFILSDAKLDIMNTELGKLFASWNRLVSVVKYPFIFSGQMETIVHL